MQSAKRIEIITSSVEMQKVCDMLETLGVDGYTIVPNVSGRGDRGIQSGDELTGVFSNSLLVTACLPERLEAIVEAVRPILKRRGGVCLVTDAMWVIH